MRLALIKDGQLVDLTDEFTRDEFIAAQGSMLAASTMLRELNVDAS